jgi:hypothetical protein
VEQPLEFAIGAAVGAMNRSDQASLRRIEVAGHFTAVPAALEHCYRHDKTEEDALPLPISRGVAEREAQSYFSQIFDIGSRVAQQ